jgi:hypothetical protein
VTVERVAALEARHDNQDDRIRRIEAKLDQVAADTSEIRHTLQRQRGFVSGMIAVILPIWSVLLAGVVVLWRRFLGE